MRNSLFLIIFFNVFLIAQENNQIDSVVFNAKKIKDISIGHGLVEIKHDYGSSLGDDLSIQTGAYFKEYGNGMLSSISYRGLGAAHTGVFFEGIPINSGLTGQTDFNLIYPDGFNSIEFRTGGGGATFGSGAVGGSVHINNNLDYNKEFKIGFTQKVASFQTYITNLGFNYSDNKNALKATINKLSSENDYDYQYNNEDFTIENGAVETLVSNVTYQRKINNYNHIKLAMNYALADRQLMESVGGFSNQKQKDVSHNSVLSWVIEKSNYSHTLSQAFLYNRYEYFPNQNVNEYDYGKTEDLVSKYDGKYKISNDFNVGIIGQYKHTEGEGSNIMNHSLSEGFISVYGQYHTANLRQNLTVSKGLSSEFDIPFSFDYGIEYDLSKTAFHANFTTNYRNPTFNDLYWNPGGNLDLKPEDGWSTEIGVSFEDDFDDKFTISFQSNIFYSNFDDWIVWLPSVDQNGIFSPINIQNVESYGFELFSGIDYTFNDIQLGWNANYTFLKSIDEEKNEQLIYTPKHKLNNQIQLLYEKSFIKFQHQFVDEIYTSSDNLNKLDSFNLFDATIGYNFKINTFMTGVELKVNNIFDEDYQLVLGRAMPSRNYSIGFNCKF